MIDLAHVLLLGLIVLAASSVPFVPTGELVSGAAALTAPSYPLAVTVFLVCWICSSAGDLVLLSAVRLLARPLQGWRQRQLGKPKVRRAQARLIGSTFSTVVTARLVPGMRAPVILALGLAGVRRRAFVRADLVGCGIWAALYTAVGTVGGRLTTHPGLAVAASVVVAVTASSVVGSVVRRRDARTERPSAAGSHGQPTPTSGAVSHAATEIVPSHQSGTR